MGKKHKHMKEMAEQIAELPAVAEEAVAAPAVAAAPEELKLDFDGWYAMRRHQIPAVHKKEILKADFRARELPVMATIAEFDEALKKYGVKLA